MTDLSPEDLKRVGARLNEQGAAALLALQENPAVGADYILSLPRHTALLTMVTIAPTLFSNAALCKPFLDKMYSLVLGDIEPEVDPNLN